MNEGRLWIGNRRYSSWSLRGWLAVRAHPLIEEWYAAAAAEPEDWRLPDYEAPPD